MVDKLCSEALSSAFDKLCSEALSSAFRKTNAPDELPDATLLETFTADTVRQYAEEMKTQKLLERIRAQKTALTFLKNEIYNSLKRNPAADSAMVQWAFNYDNPDATYEFLKLLTELGFTVLHPNKEALMQEVLAYKCTMVGVTDVSNKPISISVKW